MRPALVLRISTVALFGGCLGKMSSESSVTLTDSQGGSATAAAAAPMTPSYNHPDTTQDPFTVLARVIEEGPPELSSRLHSCSKIKISALKNLLVGLGVDLNATSPDSAAGLISDGQSTLGAPAFAARVAESLMLTTATAVKLFDIFVQASPEIIARMPSAKTCMNAGQPTSMFDSQGKCNPDAISCLKGSPSNGDDKALCDEVLSKGSNDLVAGTQVTAAQAMAVAVVLSAAHTCE